MLIALIPLCRKKFYARLGEYMPSTIDLEQMLSSGGTGKE